MPPTCSLTVEVQFDIPINRKYASDAAAHSPRETAVLKFYLAYFLCKIITITQSYDSGTTNASYMLDDFVAGNTTPCLVKIRLKKKHADIRDDLQRELEEAVSLGAIDAPGLCEQYLLEKKEEDRGKGKRFG